MVAAAAALLIPMEVALASAAAATPTCYDIEVHLGSPPYPTVTVCTPV